MFGGRETPLEACITTCDRFDKCSYYKNNQCLNIRSFGGGRCKYGGMNTVTGYTSRTKKYYEFKDKWQKHDKYNKLKYPPEKLGIIDNCVVIPYPYININKNGEIGIAYFSSNVSFVPLDDFNADFIADICEFRPYAMMGGEIKNYQNKIVPLFLMHLKEVMPNKYDEFITEYPNFKKDASHIGRSAMLKTINPSMVCYISTNYPQFNEKWYWDGENLIFKSGYVSTVNIIKKYEVVEFKIKPDESATIKITDNEQVNSDTIFID